ncbi:MAG: family 16 glycosylhydrolase, partial [bacterium]|nr:family 16 glycosylhydrolase [bacterium]
MKVWILFLLCAGIPALVGAEPPSTQYELVWSDEFKGTTLDLTKWVYRDLGPRRDGVNVQECAQLDGEGMLHLVTKKVGDAFHTAMIATQGTYETTFGYFETRVQFQKQRGHWSAFWLQSSALQQGVGDYRKYGTEIDIFEYLVRYPEILHFNLHWDGYGEDHKSEGCKIEDPTLPEGFHTVG